MFNRAGLIALLAGAALATTLSANANAAVVTIGLQEAGFNGGAITNQGSGTGIFGITGVNYGNFVVNSVSGTSEPFLTSLSGNSQNVASSTGGTLMVYI